MVIHRVTPLRYPSRQQVCHSSDKMTDENRHEAFHLNQRFIRKRLHTPLLSYRAKQDSYSKPKAKAVGVGKSTTPPGMLQPGNLHTALLCNPPAALCPLHAPDNDQNKTAFPDMAE